MLRAALLLVAVTACSSSPKEGTTSSATSTPPTGSAAGSADGTAQSAQGPKIGENCGANDACGEGQCVSYFGIAGPRGPEFKTCEIKCETDAECTNGRKCVTVADGPGRVCR